MAMAMADQRYHHHHHHVLFVALLFSCFIINSSYGAAHQFILGWVLNPPSENYNQWAERNRFQVNDSILFKYKNGWDSLLVVNKTNYENCNIGDPILKFTDGYSDFKFDRSGPFYFISGNKSSCDQGQKLIVVVLAVRNRSSPAAAPSSPSPATGAPSPSGTPFLSPSPETGAPSPTGSPFLSPSPASGAPSPAGGSARSPSPASGAPSPGGSAWSPSPVAESPGPAVHSSGPSPTAEAPTPAVHGESPSPATTNSSMSGSGTPGDVNAPGGSPRRSLAGPPCTPSILFVSFVLSVGLGGGFIVSN